MLNFHGANPMISQDHGRRIPEGYIFCDELAIDHGNPKSLFLGVMTHILRA